MAITPVRVVCNNTLNLALNTASRVWSTKHTGDIEAKMEDAGRTLFMAERYMGELANTSEILNRKKLGDAEVILSISLYTFSSRNL